MDGAKLKTHESGGDRPDSECSGRCSRSDHVLRRCRVTIENGGHARSGLSDSTPAILSSTHWLESDLE